MHKTGLIKGCISRQGVIIECPLNGFFHDTRDVILTTRTAVRELEDYDDKHPWSTFYKEMSTFSLKMLISNIVTHKNVSGQHFYYFVGKIDIFLRSFTF